MEEESRAKSRTWSEKSSSSVSEDRRIHAAEARGLEIGTQRNTFLKCPFPTTHLLLMDVSRPCFHIPLQTRPVYFLLCGRLLRPVTSGVKISPLTRKDNWKYWRLRHSGSIVCRQDRGRRLSCIFYTISWRRR